MFDIGFAELLLIAVVGLLVLGPDRLPGAVRTATLWLGKIRRNFNYMRREFEREIGAEQIKLQMHNEALMEELRNSEQKLRSTVEKASQEVKSVEQNIQAEVDKTLDQAEINADEIDALNALESDPQPDTDASAVKPTEDAGAAEPTSAETAPAKRDGKKDPQS